MHHAETRTARLGNARLHFGRGLGKPAKQAKRAASRNGGQDHVQRKPLFPRYVAAALGAVQGAIKERTNVMMKIVVVPRSELPEFTYKARRWKDQRQQGYRL